MRTAELQNALATTLNRVALLMKSTMQGALLVPRFLTKTEDYHTYILAIVCIGCRLLFYLNESLSHSSINLKLVAIS